MANAKKPAVAEEPEADPAEVEDSRMPFLAHLRELRDRVRNAALGFLVGFVVCWLFAKDIMDWLKQPLFGVWDEAKHGPKHLIFTKLTEPFYVDLSIALWAGVFVASPFIFYQLWRFIAPGLYKRERRITVAFAVSSAVFFIGGALFCYYFVLTSLYDFLLSYASKENFAMPTMSDYLDLTRDMMLAFGAVFEMPLLITFMAMIGLVTHRGLWKFNRWFVVVAFIVGAILTPSPDVVSQIMMATPMIVLYNLSIIMAWRITKKREAADVLLRERERIGDEQERAERRARRERGEPVDDDDDDE